MTEEKAPKETFASHCKTHGITKKADCLQFDPAKADWNALYRARELHRLEKGWSGDLPWQANAKD